jgi:hypothetical protein
MRRKPLILEEHFAVAEDLILAAHHLSNVFNACSGRYPLSSKVLKTLIKLMRSGNLISHLRSDLENQYWADVGDEVAHKYGFIHYLNKEGISRLIAEHRKE